MHDKFYLTLDYKQDDEGFVNGLLEHYDTPEKRIALMENVSATCYIMFRGTDNKMRAEMEHHFTRYSDYAENDVSFVNLYVEFLDCLCVPYA